jgi:hypothetical protein
VPVQCLLTVDSLEAAFNVEALVCRDSESHPLGETLLKLNMANNAMRVTLADKHEPNKKRPYNIQLSKGSSHSCHQETLMLSREEVVRYERQTLSALLKKAYVLGPKYTVLERLFEDLELQESQVVLSRYELET